MMNRMLLSILLCSPTVLFSTVIGTLQVGTDNVRLFYSFQSGEQELIAQNNRNNELDTLLKEITLRVDRKKISYKIFVLIDVRPRIHYDTSYSGFASIAIDSLSDIDRGYLITDRDWENPDTLNINSTWNDTIKEVGLKIIYCAGKDASNIINRNEILKLVDFAIDNIQTIQKNQAPVVVKFSAYYIAILTYDPFKIHDLLGWPPPPPHIIVSDFENPILDTPSDITKTEVKNVFSSRVIIIIVGIGLLALILAYVFTHRKK